MTGTENISEKYMQDGYVSPLNILSPQEAMAHRNKLEAVEADHGPIHYKSKVHTLLNFAADLAIQPNVLDLVEQFIGPDIMLFDVTYIVKEPLSKSHVSWHQDLTYWGLSNDDQVSMWLALSPATDISGCMRMIPGSHQQGKLKHLDSDDPSNVLFRGQSVQGVDEDAAIMCPLQPGQASFHHGWTLHASMPNNRDDRRIGFNVQYISPSARQTLHDLDTATLVRGTDRFNHYKSDVFATDVMNEAAMASHAHLEKRRKETWAKA